jgi:predicted lipoprotein
MTSSPQSHRSRLASPRVVLLGLFGLLLAAMVVSTEYVSASAPVPGEEEAFDAAAFGEETYAELVRPGVQQDPVDLTTLVPLLRQDAEAAGDKYGTRVGTSPYTFAVTFTGTAQEVEGGLMPVDVPGVPASTRVSVQVGPAINGTALRDVTGEIDFNDFVNQVEYADAATALNDAMKAELLKGIDPASLEGKQVTVVGATAPLNPELVTVTPVSIEEAS